MRGIRGRQEGEMGEDRTHPWEAGERWGEIRWWEQEIRDAHNAGSGQQAGTDTGQSRGEGEQGQGRAADRIEDKVT